MNFFPTPAAPPAPRPLWKRAAKKAKREVSARQFPGRDALRDAYRSVRPLPVVPAADTAPEPIADPVDEPTSDEAVEFKPGLLGRKELAEYAVGLGNSGGGSLGCFYQQQAAAEPAARLTHTPAGRPVPWKLALP